MLVGRARGLCSARAKLIRGTSSWETHSKTPEGPRFKMGSGNACLHENPRPATLFFLLNQLRVISIPARVFNLSVSVICGGQCPNDFHNRYLVVCLGLLNPTIVRHFSNCAAPFICTLMFFPWFSQGYTTYLKPSSERISII